MLISKNLKKKPLFNFDNSLIEIKNSTCYNDILKTLSKVLIFIYFSLFFYYVCRFVV